MADINVERKGPSIWPWVIGLLVLALLIWALVEMFGGDRGTVATDPARDTVIVDTPATPPPPPVTTPVTPAPGTDTLPGATPGAAPGTPGATPPGPGGTPGAAPGTTPGGTPGTTPGGTNL